MTEDLEYHITEIYRSQDDSVFVEKVDEAQMARNLNLPLRVAGSLLSLTIDEAGRQQIIASRQITESVYGVPIPFYKQRLNRATNKIIGRALDIENKSETV